MKLESLTVKNFRTLQNISITDMPGLCVFIGANGSGKSTIFDVFGFLKDALNGNVRTALQRRGGFREVVTRGHENEPIEITLQFRLPIHNVNRLVTYVLEITTDKGRPVVSREVLRYKRKRYGSPYQFLNFSYGSGYAIVNEEDFDRSDEELEREEQELDSADILAVKGLGQFQRFRAANAFRQLIENWHVSDFHISEARPSRDAAYAEHLTPQGDNTALVAQYLYEQHPDMFATILEKMKQRVPGIEDVKAVEMDDGRIVLKFQDGSFKDPFIARYVSDGTIKMFAYLLLLNDPSPHPLLCIEEPENQLYPGLMDELAEEFREYAHRGGQVMVSTHSPDLLNSVELDEIYWLRKKNGVTEVMRASESELLASLVSEGDLPGALWKQGLFEGIDPQ